eukprot:scaffold24686_cov42-Attheya_sp.AAC.1
MTPSASCSSLLSTQTGSDSSSIDQQQQCESSSSQEDSAWGHFLDVEFADADLTKHSRILMAQERRHFQHQQANNNTRMLRMVPVQYQ